MLTIRRDTHYSVSPRRTSSCKKWGRTTKCFEFEFGNGFRENCTAPWLSSKTPKHGIPLSGRHGTPDLSQEQIFNCAAKGGIFCVLENQPTHVHASHVSCLPSVVCSGSCSLRCNCTQDYQASVAFQWIPIGTEEYLATDRVETINHIKRPVVSPFILIEYPSIWYLLWLKHYESKQETVLHHFFRKPL